MSCEPEIAGVLRETGQRLTPQRLAILSILRHAGGHLTAAEILDRVRQVHPYVDISTVYRTMAACKELRLVSETDMGSGEFRYEWTAPAPHHHLVCRECGREVSFDHRYLETMQKRLLQDYGFHAEMEHFAIFGTCRACWESRMAGAG